MDSHSGLPRITVTLTMAMAISIPPVFSVSALTDPYRLQAEGGKSGRGTQPSIPKACSPSKRAFCLPKLVGRGLLFPSRRRTTGAEANLNGWGWSRGTVSMHAGSNCTLAPILRMLPC